MSIIHEKLKNYILVDGFHHVADLKNSHGSWFVDAVTGKEYLDLYSQFASQPLGWNHPKIKQNITKFGYALLNPIANSDVYTEPYLEFVEEFAKVTSDFKHYFFISGGTLGVENALKAAFDWKAQKLGWDDYHDFSKVNDLDVIHLTEAFHGRSGYTLSLTNTGVTKTKWYPQFRWTRIANPKIVEGYDHERLEQVSLNQAYEALKSNKVAAIILETIQGEGGDNHFRPEYLQALKRLATEHEAMFILDEVQCGLGLTGKMWAYQHSNVIPDMICFGKKTQVCGFCTTNKIDEIPNNVFNISGRINSTWGGNLVDMIRSTIYLKIIEEDNLVDNARVVGEYFLEQLKELPLKNVRGRGLMIAFDLLDTRVRDTFLGKMNEKLFCLKSGEKSIRLRPHLTLNKEEVDFAVEHIKRIL
jgi:L-lysine 6-transaminase